MQASHRLSPSFVTDASLGASLPTKTGWRGEGPEVPGFTQRRNLARTTALSHAFSPKRGLSLCFFMTDGRRTDQVNEVRVATVNMEMRLEGQAQREVWKPLQG